MVKREHESEPREAKGKNYFTFTQEMWERKRAVHLAEKRNLTDAARKAAAAVGSATVASTAPAVLRNRAQYSTVPKAAKTKTGKNTRQRVCSEAEGREGGA